MSGVIIRQDIDSNITEIESVLPKSVSIDVFCRAAKIAISDNQDLNNADATSVIKSLSKCAADGLVPDGREAALVVFNKKVKINGRDEWQKHAQYMPMVDGVLKRARLSGEVLNVSAKAVFENDQFDYWVDESGEHFKHRPLFSDQGDLKLVYAFARLKSGELVFEPMSKAEVDKVRAASKTGEYGPWKDWYERMALKSVLHRLTRRLPNASEMVEMLEMGNQMNFQNNEKDVSPQPKAVADHSDKFPVWLDLVSSGKKTAQQLIEFLAKKNIALTEEQQQQLFNAEAIDA